MATYKYIKNYKIMENYDVIIVGARCSGACTAAHLSKMGFKVLNSR